VTWRRNECWGWREEAEDLAGGRPSGGGKRKQSRRKERKKRGYKKQTE
jgi:hypothetical protein